MRTNTKDTKKGRRRLPSPAMIVAMLALLVGLSGSALAVNAAKNSVTTKSIRNGAVKSKKLADKAVKTKKLADNAVKGAQLADGTVTEAKLADKAVSTAKLGDDAVTAANLAANSVDSAALADNAVDNAAIADNAVDNVELAEEAVSVGKIEPGAISASRFYEATAVQIDFPSIAAQNCTASQPSGFENLQASDRIVVNPPAGLAAPVIIKAAAQQGGIVLTACNISGATVDPASLAYRILVIRQ